MDTDVDFIIDILSIMPHAIHARIIPPDNVLSSWEILEEQYIVGQASDLTLKHGVIVPGEWVMPGILDAFPGEHTNEETINALAELAGSFIGEAATRLAPATRQALGRPAWAHGVTPLLIFREISA